MNVRKQLMHVNGNLELTNLNEWLCLYEVFCAIYNISCRFIVGSNTTNPCRTFVLKISMKEKSILHW